MHTANQRIKELDYNLKKLLVSADDDDDSDDDDLDDREGLKVELEELKKANAARQAKLDEFEKHKKWNVDNICHIAEERTLINPSAAEPKFTPTGYALPDDEEKPTSKPEAAKPVVPQKSEEDKKLKAAPVAKKSTAEATKPEPQEKTKAVAKVEKAGPQVETEAILTYHEFTEKYADLVEDFMKIKDLDKCKEFLLLHGDVLLQENASNYLLLASLEDEMNGFREKMRQTARQSQIISNIAELAKSLKAHPGNVIVPFFERLKQKEFLVGFLDGVEGFVEKIIARAVTKKMEIDREREQGGAEDEEAVELSDIPKEERLGPGGLDPLEVVESLPESMQAAFASRDVEELKKALMEMDPADAEYHMKRCVDSGLWNA